jgi:hypothetical protein
MDTLEEAKEIMEKIGCDKAFAVYGLKLENIAEVKGCNENGEEIIELENDIHNLTPIIEKKLVLDQDKPIQCPINLSMSKYLEFSLKSRKIKPYNIDNYEAVRIEEIINPLLKKYSWTINK